MGNFDMTNNFVSTVSCGPIVRGVRVWSSRISITRTARKSLENQRSNTGTPHPSAFECKSVQAPVSCRVIDYNGEVDECSVLLEIENRYDYISLDHLIMTWHVEIDGDLVGGFRKEYEFEKSVKPRSSTKIMLSWSPDRDEGMEDMYLIVRFETREDTAWASSGHVITEVSLRVPVEDSRPPDIESKSLDTEPLSVNESKDRIVVGMWCSSNARV